VPVAFVSGGIIVDGTQRELQAAAAAAAEAEASRTALCSESRTPDDGAADTCMQESQQSELGEGDNAETCMNSNISAVYDDPNDRSRSQGPDTAAAEPSPPGVAFAAQTHTERSAGSAPLCSGAQSGVILTSAFEGLRFEDERQEGLVANDGCVAVAGASPTGASKPGDAAAMSIVEPRALPQPRLMLGQSKCLQESSPSSPDDATALHPGLGFPRAAARDPALAGELIPASTTDMDVTDAQFLHTDEPVSLSGAHGTAVQAGVPSFLQQAAAGQPEVPLFDIEMPVLGQSRQDRGAPQPTGATPSSKVSSPARYCATAA
jgi:hypothetical protein